MTRKDYKLIAKALNDFNNTSIVDNKKVEIGHIENLVEIFASELERENSNFDIGKFRKAVFEDSTRI